MLLFPTPAEQASNHFRSFESRLDRLADVLRLVSDEGIVDPGESTTDGRYVLLDPSIRFGKNLLHELIQFRVGVIDITHDDIYVWHITWFHKSEKYENYNELPFMEEEGLKMSIVIGTVIIHKAGGDIE